MKTYSCDECKNRGMTSRCKRCIHTADKKPTKFKLDKNAVPCPAYSNDNKECNLIAEIRVWKEEIKKNRFGNQGARAYRRKARYGFLVCL